MILNHLTLRNFCLYAGEHCLDLRPAGRRGRIAPIVLFGGINGGGKTTLLDAVQLALYGNRARCSKRGLKAYEDFLRESIHHGADPSDGAAVGLSFQYAAEGEDHLYEVIRSWSIVQSRLRERVQVSKDGQIDTWMSANWNLLVDDLIPLGIAQLCFFDAEKIRFLAEDEAGEAALGSAIKSLLGLDLAERLVTDAVALEGRIAKRVRGSAEFQEFNRLEEAVDAKQREVDRLLQELGALENPRQAAQNRLEGAEERFSRIGGRHWEQREARQRKLGELEHAIDDSRNRLVALAGTELPLALVRDLLGNVSQQAEREKTATENGIVLYLLRERDERLLAELEAKGLGANSTAPVRIFLEADRAQRATLGNVEPRLGLSDAGRRLLSHLLDGGLVERQGVAKQLLDHLDHWRRSLEDVQRSVAAVPQEDTVREAAEELKAASAELASFDQRARRLEKQLAGVRMERDDLQRQLQRLRRKVVDEQIRSEEDGRIAQLLLRTQDTMQKFLRRATTRKIDHLSELITDSFRYLLRKKTLARQVHIDPETFGITLYDDTGRTIQKHRLSEGEKQIFAISVLWGLSRASARPLPAIIDTPMARLDARHRAQLVECYFPHASHQVIVLSTDTEVERRYFHDMEPHIARAYHLKYDDQKKATAVEEGYFWGAKATEQVARAAV